MKKLNLAIVLTTLLTCCAVACSADTWTSANGETLEGEFVSYSASTKTISIKRAYDDKVFAIPEDQLTHPDRIKAIRLHNKDIPEYWYTDYEKAKKENPNKRCLILYRNGAKAENFELFCIQLLLREDFVKLLNSRGVIACMPTTIPDEIGLIESYNADGTLSRSVRIEKNWPQQPMALIADFAAEKRANERVFRARIPLYQPSADPNPFLVPPENSPYLDFEEIEKRIRRLKRP